MIFFLGEGCGRLLVGMRTGVLGFGMRRRGAARRR